MQRRDFVKKMAMAGGMLTLNNIPLSVLAQNSFLEKIAAGSDNDRVLVLIQLHGGNDGLNTLVPLSQYNKYQELRPNIALPKTGNGARNLINLDPSLSAEKQVGIHPDMGDLRSLYDNGLASIIQAVGYKNMNGSHFRSRDIWFMGGDYDDYLPSGWMGRYLYEKFPGYPDSYPNSNMPDPLALEIGNNLSLAFHTGQSIPASISIDSPDAFFNLIDGVVGSPGVDDNALGAKATPPDSIKDTKYADELRWIMEFQEKADKYSIRLKDVFLKGSNSANVSYPEQYPFTAPANAKKNRLAPQLKLIARLLSGGVKTKIFLARIGGFDTHANQIEPGSDNTYGVHAAKLQQVFSSVKAFQDDLRGLGLEDRVMTMTISEFGRRAESNFSYGTDHGTAAPMFVFGKHVKPGIKADNPDLSDLDNGNIKEQVDYRQIFGEIVTDWFIANDKEKTAINFDPLATNPKLGIVNDNSVGIDEKFYDSKYRLEVCYPNPVHSKTTFKYFINQDTEVKLSLFDQNGLLIKILVDEKQLNGEHLLEVDLSDLNEGIYTYTLEVDKLKASKRLLKQ